MAHNAYLGAAADSVLRAALEKRDTSKRLNREADSMRMKSGDEVLRIRGELRQEETRYGKSHSDMESNHHMQQIKELSAKADDIDIHTKQEIARMQQEAQALERDAQELEQLAQSLRSRS